MKPINNAMKGHAGHAVNKAGHSEKPAVADVRDVFTKSEKDSQTVDAAKASKLLFQKKFSLPDLLNASPLKDAKGIMHKASTAPIVQSDGTVFVRTGKTIHSYNHKTGDFKLLLPDNMEFSEISSLAVGRDNLFLGALDGKVFAVDKRTNQVKWEQQMVKNDIAQYVAAGPDDNVYVTSLSGSVRCLDGKTGKWKWHEYAGAPVMNRPSVGKDGTVYVGVLGNQVVAYDGKTGRRKWKQRIDETPESPVVEGQNNTLYLSCTRDKLVALDADTGDKKWDYNTHNDLHNTRPVVAENGTVFIASRWNLHAVNGETGRLKWKHKLDDKYHKVPVVLPGNTVCVAGRRGELKGIDLFTGSEKWENKLEKSIDAPPAVGRNGLLYLGCDHHLYTLKPPMVSIEALERENIEKGKEGALRVEVGKEYVNIDGVRLPVND